MSRSAAVALAVLVAGTAAPLRAQSEGGDETALRREIFDYPGEGRRDPFAPLTAGADLGPRFEDLDLAGVIYSPEAGSVAVLVDRATRKRYRAREGDRLGDAQVLHIREGEAVFVVSSFGVSRRETLRVRKREQEPG